MSEKIGNTTLIYEEEPQQCDDCGKIEELRPYGPNYSMVCHDCAMKDPIGTEIRMAYKLFGDVITEEKAKEIIEFRKTKSKLPTTGGITFKCDNCGNMFYMANPQATIMSHATDTICSARCAAEYIPKKLLGDK